MSNLPWGAILGFLIIGAIGYAAVAFTGNRPPELDELLVFPPLFGAFGMTVGAALDVVRSGRSMADGMLRFGAGMVGLMGGIALIKLMPRSAAGMAAAIACALGLGLHAWISKEELGPVSSLLATLFVGCLTLGTVARRNAQVADILLPIMGVLVMLLLLFGTLERLRRH